MKPAVRIRSTMMGLLASEGLAATLRWRARLRRKLSGQPPVVHYFHQVDDPYSYLAVQKLTQLQASYQIRFIPHLVGPPDATYQGDSSRFQHWARRDAGYIAEFHQVDYPPAPATPSAETIHNANNLLTAVIDSPEFADSAQAVGRKLWYGEPLPENRPGGAGLLAIESGNQLRARLGHYYSGMFYFDGEWYWGLDRLHLLEARLQNEQFGVAGRFCAPMPTSPPLEGLDASQVTLEYFPSLRSPYTAIGHDRVADLVARTGVNLVLRPVIPMMMRGVPAPRHKKLYIMADAAREARYYGVPFGHFVDPLGAPVLRAFSYYPAAMSAGKGMTFVGAYLSAAFARGLDVTSKAGLAHVLEEAGIGSATIADNWQSVLQENLDAMNEAGLWGVPSFRVTGGNDPTTFACWGQDRIWRTEIEIQRRAQTTTAGATHDA